MENLCSKIIDGKFQLYFRITFKEHFENMHLCHRTSFKQKSVWSFRNFLPRQTYFTKQVAMTHRNTVITHLIYLKFSFTPVCIVSSGRLFLQKENMTCLSEFQFSYNHNYVATIFKIDYRTFQNLFDLGLEYCYELFQAIKCSIANWKSSKYSRNNRF